ncbi:MAG TPA: Maf family protein [Acidobacteriota bacterium]|nr:Maf family protein [Acidobacteriota bacterium]
MARVADPEDLILASASPRRRELLKRIAPGFRVVPSRADEASVRETDSVRFAVAAALLKARDVGGRNPASLVLAADTVVSLGGEIFGKPADRDEARATLKKLSGRRHRVITGVALYRKDEGRSLTGYEESLVRFRPLDERAVEGYLDTEDHVDKAGSYAIQEVDDAFVEELVGDYDNVVGLPLRLVEEMLRRFRAGERDGA